MKFKRTVLAVSISAAIVTLTACGGGGGGGTSATLNPYLRSQVPFYTPTRVATVDPLVPTTNSNAIINTYSGNITNGAGDDIVYAGFNTTTGVDSSISLLSWQNGTLVDKTAQWFPNGINQAPGFSTLSIGEFNNNGRKDILGVVGKDNGYFDYVYLYTNTGSNFTRSTINLPGATWAHDSTVADLNQDGYQDVVIASFGPNSTFLINNQAGSFTPYIQTNTVLYNAASIAVGDFLTNGTRTIIATDPVGPGSNAQLFSWAITNNNFDLTFISNLPTPRFMLPKWASYNFGDGQGASHDIRAVSYDFNSDGKMDVIILSRPWYTQGTWPNYSEIQFLKNNGSGNFTDVTDTTLVGYNTSTVVSYNPKFIDLNGDGLTDILVSGLDFTGRNNSHQFLIKTREGQYVAAHANILTDLVNQVYNLQSPNVESGGASVTLLQGPNNKLFLVSYAQTVVNGDRQMAVYLSELGTQTTTAEATISAIRQVWPYMSATQVNDMLARTSATYLNGRIIDLDALFSPIGQLGISTNNKITPLNGYINGVKLNSDVGKVIALDELRRDFTINISPMSINGLNFWGRNTEFVETHEINSQSQYLVNAGINTLPYGMKVGQDPKNFTLGTPSFRLNDRWTINGQYTSLSFNPWIQINGVWGEVKSSVITEMVSTYKQDNFVTQFGILHNSTQISPGLVTRINDSVGMWAEAGYQWRDHRGHGLGIYTGVRPVMLSGGVEVRMPTSVDTHGNINYTNKKLAIQNPANTYIRMVYTGELNRQTSYSFGGTLIDNRQYRAQATVRFNF